MKKTGPTFPYDVRASWLKMMYYLPFLLITNLAAILHAQDRSFKFEHLGTEQGLSQSTVYCMLQDHQGFMWFGTQAGLNKFDGYGFTVYRHEASDSLSLSSNLVCAIYEDHTHTLWFGTVGGGLSRFDRDKEQFMRFVHDANDPHSRSFNSIGAIYEDRSGTLWIGTADLNSEAGGGLNKFDREKQQFSRFVHDSSNAHSLSDGRVWAIYEDHNATLLTATNNNSLTL